jgi:predicted TIM-barrel fold metal-dependent hydrolase
MTVIDSDAHVVENEQTWDYLEPSAEKYRPRVISLPEGAVAPRAWLIDGKLSGLRQAPLSELELERRSEQIGRNVVTPQESREMREVTVRIGHMDELGIDIEVLHNTVFILQVSDRAEVEVPICRAWNRWLADIWKQGDGRLRWTCVPPTLSVSDSLDEIRFGKQHGAVGVLMRPIEGSRTIVDPYFYPLYEEASRLNMPIVIHIANANPSFTELYDGRYETGPAFGRFMAPTVVACHQIIMSRLSELFPDLRWVIVEAGAEWLPWVVGEARRRYQVDGRRWPDAGFSDFNIYVTCQTNNDLPFIIKTVGEDRLLIGTDYGHIDISSEVDAITVLRETSGLEPGTIQKIVDSNPKAAFAI